MNCFSFIIIHQIQHSRPRKAWDIIYNSDIFLSSLFLSFSIQRNNQCMFYIRPESSLSSSFSKTTNLNLLSLRLDGELLSLGKYNTQETRKISPSPNLKVRWISDRYILKKRKEIHLTCSFLFCFVFNTIAAHARLNTHTQFYLAFVCLIIKLVYVWM